MGSPPCLGIVVPCYNEEAVLPKTATALRALLADLTAKGAIAPESFICFVDDGSSDGTWGIIQAMHRDNAGLFKGIALAHNSGHQIALMAGLFSVCDKAEIAISVDADLQDDVSVMESFIEEYQTGHEIVYGVRRRRDSDTIFKRFTARLFYWLMGRLGVTIIPDHSDYRLTSQRVIRELQGFGEVNLFLRGIFPLMGFRSAHVAYDRLPRQAGATKYPLRKMLSFAWEGITSFSIAPLRLMFLAGVVLFVFCGIMIVWNLYNWLIGGVIPGWTSTVLPIYTLGAIQLMSIGILGEYVGKIYKETKRRPRFLIDRELS